MFSTAHSFEKVSSFYTLNLSTFLVGTGAIMETREAKALYQRRRVINLMAITGRVFTN